MTHFGLLQIFRGWAAILVVLVHATGIAASLGAPIAGNFFLMGNAGVDFFFVLSGFLITYLHLNDIGRREKLGGYARKRFVRIFPIYWVVTLVILPVFFLFPRYGQGDETTPFVIVSSIILTPLERGSPILVAGWSLTHELLFYVIVAALIAFRGLWVKVIVATWALAVFVAFCYSFNQIYAKAFPEFNAWVRVLLWPQNFEFILGAAAAWLIARRPNLMPNRRVALILLPIGCLLFMASGFFSGSLLNIQAGQHVAYFGSLSFLIVLAAVVIDKSGGLSDGVRQSGFYRLQEYFGDSSYSIYLVHGPALSVAYKVAAAWGWFQLLPGWLVNLALCVSVVIACCLCHWIIERPLLNFFGRGKRMASQFDVAKSMDARA